MVDNSCDCQKRQIVLVFGGTGLVGSAIKNEVFLNKIDDNLERTLTFIDKYEFVFLSSKDADLTDFDQTKKLFELYKPEFVINLAAKVGGLYANIKDNEAFYDINYKINQNVLKLSYNFKVKKCFSCLSTCIFPNEIEQYPLDETMIHLGPPHKSNIGYSIAKRQVDLLNILYNGLNQEDGIFSSFIPTNIYGCNDNFNSNESHVIPGLIYKVYESIRNRDNNEEKQVSFHVYGSGKSVRQFIYAPDLAKLILWCLENYNDTRPIILCPDESDEISIGEVALIIAEIFEKKFDIKINVLYDVTWNEGQIKKTSSNKKLRILNPNFRFTNIVDGLTKVIDWYCSVYPNVRI